MSENSTIKIELTAQEANTLMQLLDVAIKAGGLNVAQSAVYFASKLQPKPKEE